MNRILQRATGFIPVVAACPDTTDEPAANALARIFPAHRRATELDVARRERDTTGINPVARCREPACRRFIPTLYSPLSTLHSLPRAFTLVEMLVAVGLVVLMMTLFASIFQMATGMMATQKGLTENDQRARLVETLLRNDLNGSKADINNNDKPRSYRTFRIILPWAQNETTAPIDPVSHVPADPGDRVGYFTISENNPFDDTDDVLALTVAIPATSNERYYGKAAILFPDSTANMNYGPTASSPGSPYPGQSVPAPAANANGSYWVNQPEFDDFLGAINQAGNSTVAEVCYFLRHGTLYRRVLLVRSPAVSPAPLDGQPTDANGAPLSLTVYTQAGKNPPPIRNFWGDFDYSAFNDSNGNLKFHFNLPGTIDSLSVGSQNLGGVNPQVLPQVLGNPAYRFGYDDTLGTSPPTFGQPREHDSNGIFIGRFTQQETSNLGFGYPGIVNATYLNPMSVNTSITVNSVSGAVQPYNGGYRAGEDALMANVLKFDIKVWDPKASFGPDGAPGIVNVDDDGDGRADTLANGNLDLKELGAPGSDDGAFVDIGHFGKFGCYNFNSSANLYYSPGLISANQAPILFSGGNNIAPWQNTQWPNGSPVFINRFDSWNPYLDLDGNGKVDLPPFGPVPQTSLTNLTQQNNTNPSWWTGFFPIGIGTDGRPGRAGFDDNGNGVIDDFAELGTPGTDDFLPLTAIQIKITFYDTTSKQLKEMTFVQSLLYTP